MIDGGYRFFLVFRSKAGVVHEEELDFNALFQDVTFSAVCGGRLPNDGRWGPAGVEPEWAGERLKAVTVRVASSSRTYSRAVFRDRAAEVLQTRKLLSEAQTDEQPAMSWDVEVRSWDTATRTGRRAIVRHQAYPLVHRALRELGVNRKGAADNSVSVLASPSLIEELREASANSLDCERADFLAGHLVKEPQGGMVVVLRSRFPVKMETGSSTVHFSFSPQSFLTVQRELEQCGNDEVILGWHHNHPPPCGRTCLMLVPPCKTNNAFFSIDDRIVHRSAFARPYMVALVSGKGAGRRADDPVLRAYGWRRGRVRERRWSMFSNGG